MKIIIALEDMEDGSVAVHRHVISDAKPEGDAFRTSFFVECLLFKALMSDMSPQKRKQCEDYIKKFMQEEKTSKRIKLKQK